MNKVPENVKLFLVANKVATICFIDNANKPYCINCFYCFDELSNVLIFKSSLGTTHQNYLIPFGNVSGTILPDVLDTLKLKDLQFTGTIIQKAEADKLSLSYLKKYPMSMAIAGYSWGIKLEFMKFTDNTLGFGNKIIWNDV
jgi:uncharacterized protein YhbP (UPF0306 family)